ncbi:glutarate dioxygenase GlaH [Alkalihalobacterium chitinilyticum]|uniref:Glutarate dioxygenase GlaH n=1 Tax=Alkalihalobacterium chitinilyticum TaxID=2980103 RepID=A0ABT5VMA8_9BACI|nr:glutarate dioxygenase GlaH [Alkalihalobacterium chitinilyticum]MDE5415409.1 glutarate dioxygenase GlaH [Alkalihalobacterium chitinilyticum]
MKTVEQTQLINHIQSNQNFKVEVNPQHKRLLLVTINEEILDIFYTEVEKIDLQRLKYVEFERYYLANKLDELIGNNFASVLTGILKDRYFGGFSLNGNSELSNKTNFIKLSTAITHCVGKPMFDAMTGNYYAEFAVKHTDDSDTYLRSAYKSLHLHSDGAYEADIVEWLLMMKLDEQNAEAGNSKLLHIDDWKDQKIFSENPLGLENVKRQGAKSKNVEAPQYRPTFFEHNGSTCICYAEQNIKPKNMEQAMYFKEMFNSLEESEACVSFHIPIGELVVLNNLFWLHGREPFKKHENLNRVLLRQRGRFVR